MTSIREAIKRLFAPVSPLPKGIYHYQASPSTPQPYRMHLRLDPEGNGLLIVNASTVLHLNQTAAEYAYHLVKGLSEEETIRKVANRYRVSHKRATEDYQDLVNRIQTLIDVPNLDPEMYLGFDRMALSDVKPSAPYRLDCAVTYRLPSGVNPDFAPTKRVERELSTQEWIQVLDKAWAVGIPHIVFSGGEPTLREDLPEIVAHAEENGQVTGLITDGLFFSEPQKLDILLQTGLDHITITLQVDSKDAWSALENAALADIFVVVHLTINLQNALEADETLKKIARLGIKNLSLSIADISLQDTFTELRNTAASLGLSLIWDLPVPYSAFNPVALETQEDAASIETSPSVLYIEPDGDVLPSQGVNLVLGNLLSDPWENIWR